MHVKDKISHIQTLACMSHAAWPSPLCDCSLSCAIMVWLCPTEQPCLALGTHPSLTTATYQRAIRTVWSETRTQAGQNAVLTQVTANNCMHFYTLAKHSPVNSEKYAVMLCILVKEFENKFQEC